MVQIFHANSFLLCLVFFNMCSLELGAWRGKKILFFPRDVRTHPETSPIRKKTTQSLISYIRQHCKPGGPLELSLVVSFMGLCHNTVR